MLIGEWCCEELDVRDVFALRMLSYRCDPIVGDKRTGTLSDSLSFSPSLPPSLHFSSLPFALFVSSLSLHLFDSFFLALFKRESHVYVIFVTFDFCLSFYCPQPFTGFATGLYCEVCACVICSRDTGFATDLYCEMCARYTTFHLQGVATSPRGRYILGNSR